jgi:hypothetical protein
VPHLSEIQKKYAGKVNVIGLNVFEDSKATDNSYFSKIDQYIADMGPKMTYMVAADGFEGKMAKAWMEASESRGIPTSMVVGKDGTVLWIGHPQAGLDKVLDEVIAGKYDLAGAAAKDKQRRDTARASREAFAPINNAIKAGDTKTAVIEIDKAVAKQPKLAVNLGLTKFNLLLRSDEPAAMAWAKALAEGAAKDDVNALNTLAWGIVDDKAKVKNPDFGVAVQIAERGFSLAKEEEMMYAFIGDTLAYALYKNGQIDRAIEIQAKSVAAAEKLKDFPAPTMKEMRERLDMFKAKKGSGGGGG